MAYINYLKKSSILELLQKGLWI